MTNRDIAGQCEKLRSSAAAFREHTVYDSEGDPLRLIAQADEADEAADTLERQAAEIKRLREASDGLLAAMFECQDKLWVGRCDSRDDGFRAAAERAVEMADAARDKYRAALTGEAS